MSSSLAQQLRGIASLDADRITSHHGAPAGKSYLFAPKEAAALDLDAIFNIASAGFDELLELDPKMEEFEDDFFSERSKRVDRMMLTGQENEKLGLGLDKCLGRLSKWMTLKSAGKCLEWLIRRFRVHELNVKALLHCFLPYHASPLFPRILAILLIPKDSPYFHLLKPLQKSPIPLSRELLLRYLSPQKDPSLLLLREIIGMLPIAVDSGVDHRALYNFYTATMVDFIEKERSERSGVTESVGRVLVEGLVRALCCTGGGSDLGPAVYPPLLLLVRSLPLSLQGYLPILRALPINTHSALPHRILTLLIVLEHAPATFDGDLGPEWTDFFMSISDMNRTEQLEEVKTLVAGVWNGVGLRRGYGLLLQWFARTPQNFGSIISSMISVDDLPLKLVSSIATQLDTSATIDEESKDVLAQMHQRYPGIQSIPAASSSATENKKRKRGDVSSANLARMKETSPFLLAVSSDEEDRVSGCSALLEKYRTGLLLEDEKQQIRSIILDRLKDHDVEVVGSIYGSSTLLTLVRSDALLEVLEAVFYDYATPRDTLLRHLNFIGQLGPDVIPTGDLFRKVIFPVLICSKARKVTVVAIWKTLAASPLLQRQESTLKDLSDTLMQQMEPRELNDQIAAVLARNIAGSTESADMLDFLLDQASNVDKPNQVKLLALLVLEKVLPLLPVATGVDMGNRLLSVISFTQVDSVKEEESEQKAATPEADLLQRIYAKPSHEKTIFALRAGLLLQLGNIALPVGGIEWLSVMQLAKPISGGAHSLLYKLYSLANSSALPSMVSTTLLQRVFRQLKDQSMFFLAGAWTQASEHVPLRLASLRYAKAFVSACVDTSGLLSKDFQLIVPTLLVAMTDADDSIRRAALGVVNLLAKHAPEAQVEPFGLDDIYGETSQEAKLLDHNHCKQYLTALSAASAEISVDRKALTQIHSRLLNAEHGEGKKQASYRREVTIMLGSHVKAWRSLSARTSLLRILEGVTGSKKLEVFQDLVVELQAQWVSLASWWQTQDGPGMDKYIKTVVAGVDQGVVKLVSKGDVKFFEALLSMVEQQPALPIAPTAAISIVERMRLSVFGDLSIDWQLRVVRSILKGLGSAPTDVVRQYKLALRQLPLTSYGLVQIFNGFVDSLAQGDEPAQKRSRRDDSTTPSEAQLQLTSLMTFLESRDVARIPETASLMASCLNLLSESMQHHEDIPSSLTDYIQQTLLLALTHMARKIKDTSAVVAEALSVETVIRLIRNSTNPRTSQQALLFVGSLAHLTPDAVLHNVMPIFTYIGSSDFQRDDSHSFSVVERTVESIVPIMVNSAKAATDNELDLLRELRPLLRIFADMASRLPSHRTVPFFSHLVETFGAKAFLAMMVMLLSDRTAAKSAKTRSGPSPTGLQVSIAVLASQGLSLQVEALDEILQETHRLLRFQEDQSAEQPLLAPVPQLSEEDRERYLYARALTLVSLCHKSLPVSFGSSSSSSGHNTGLSISRQLLRLSTSIMAVDENAFAGPIRQIAAQLLDRVLGMLPVTQFLELAQQILEGDSRESISKILVILQERIPLIQPTMRETLSNRFSDILKIVLDLAKQTDRTHTEDALAVYACIVKAQVTAEDGAIAQSVPVLLDLAKSRDEAILSSKAMDCLMVLPKRLLTRMIPFIKPILDMSLLDFQSPITPITTARIAQSLSLSSQIISSVPGFIPTASLRSTLLAIFALPTSIGEEGVKGLINTVARRISTQNLFPIIFDIWNTDLQKGTTTTMREGGIVQDDSTKARVMKRFFLLVQRTIKAASRSAFQPLIKSLFTFFLSAFDLRSSYSINSATNSTITASQVKGKGKEIASNPRLTLTSMGDVEIESIESMIIEAFLDMVEKLNEQGFKPLFARVCDWAFVADIDGGKDVEKMGVGRKVVVYRILEGLIDKFKSIMTPYISLLFDSTLGLLSDFAEGKANDAELFRAILGMLKAGLEGDDGAFWNTETLEKMIGSLGKQVGVAIRLGSSTNRAADNPLLTALSQTLTSLSLSTTSDLTLKSLNSTLLLLTRSADAQIRMGALMILQSIWSKQEEMVQFVPETVAQFLGEVLEDENGDVVLEGRKLLGRIEGMVGDLSSYLE